MRALILLFFVASVLLGLFVTAAMAGAPKEKVYTFTQSQLDKMQDELGETVRRREQEAYEDGRLGAEERCPFRI